MQTTHETDEIDLRQLALIIFESWPWWVGSSVLAAVLAFFFVSTQEDVYTTQFIAVPQVEQHYEQLNEIQGIELEPEQVISDFSNRLRSSQNFIANTQSIDGLSEAFNETTPQEFFAEQWTVNWDDQSETLTVEFDYHQTLDGADIVNQYVALTAERVWRSYINRLEAQNSASIRRTEEQIEQLEQRLLRERDQRLDTLSRAIEVAQELEIETPTTPQDYGRQPTGNEVFYANIGTENNSLPLYFLGYRVLEAERQSILENYEDGLLSGEIIAAEDRLRQLQQIQRLLSTGTIDQRTGLDDLPYVERLVNVVEFAAEPETPNASNKALILIAAVLVGGFLGLMLALLVRFARSVREYAEQQ